jgi:hypothetical protein
MRFSALTGSSGSDADLLSKGPHPTAGALSYSRSHKAGEARFHAARHAAAGWNAPQDLRLSVKEVVDFLATAWQTLH